MKTVLRVRSTADLLALVPVTLGFEPEESLVVVATAGARSGFQARIDLPGPRDVDPVANYLAAAVAAQDCTRVAVIAFSHRPGPASDAVTATGAALQAVGIEVLDLLRAADGRYWSLQCADVSCCPPAGTPYDPRSTALRAEAVLAGRTIAPDRAALAARYAAPTGPALEEAEGAVAAAESAVVGVLGLRRRGQLRRPGARLVRAAAPLGAASVDATLEHLVGVGARRGPREPAAVAAAVTAEVAATLAVWCSFVPVRDLAWSRMTRPNAETHLAMWAEVSRRVVAPYEPAVLGLTAFAAWLTGDGASAWCVLDRCARVAPRYPMAALVVDALDRCVPPDVWEPLPQPAILG